MSQYLFKGIIIPICILLSTLNSFAQLPSCDQIYIKSTTNVKNYNPALPLSATNPVVNTIVFPAAYGLTVCPVLKSGSATLTFYCVDPATATYIYYDPVTSAWVYTGHSTGSSAAVNIAAGGDYIYSLVGATGEVYRYDGTGTGVLIVTVPVSGMGPYDLVADCEGNWYIFDQQHPTKPFLKKYNSSGTLLHTWVVYNPLGLVINSGAGFAILGTTLYTDHSAGGGIGTYSLGKDTLTVVSLTASPSLLADDDLGCCAGNVPTRPEVALKATKTSLCAGSEPVTITATPLAGGPGPVYQWLVNGLPVGGSGPTYTYSPVNGDQVVCIMTSNSPCASPPVVGSDTIKMVVYAEQPKPPTVVSPVTYCKWVTPTALKAKKTVASSKLYWYTAATGGTASLTPPVPSTTTSGSFTYYVSEGDGDCESPRVLITVIIYDAASISDVTSGSPTSCGGLDGFIRFKTNKALEVYKVNYDKNGLAQPELTFTSDVSGYITMPALGNGSYTAITITNSLGCVSPPYYGPIELKGPTGPAPAAGSNSPVCEGDMVQLSSALVAGTTYQWSGPDGFSSTEANVSFPATEESAGKYTLVVTRSGCVSEPGVTTLVVAKLPKKQNHADQIICEGSDLFAEQYKELNTEYEWTNDAGDFRTASATLSRKNLQLNQGGAYLLKAENDFGCVMQDTVLVLVDPKTTLTVSRDTAICFKDSISLLAVSNTQSVAWTPSKGIDAGSKTPRVSPSETTTYTVVAQSDHSACADVSAKVTVRVLSLPEVSAADTTVRMNIPYQLAPFYSGNVVQWQWTPADSLSCTTCPNPVFNSSKEVSYVVRATSSDGCVNTDQVTVKVFCDGANVTMPNAFTPNGDGVNDVFYVRGKGFTVKSFNIYNRLGVLVFSKENFHPNDQKFGWDGTFNGQVVTDVAGFVYMLEAVCLNSTNAPALLKGTVLMIR
jgi:gliding motility-associated-like protein